MKEKMRTIGKGVSLFLGCIFSLAAVGAATVKLFVEVEKCKNFFENINN